MQLKRELERVLLKPREWKAVGKSLKRLQGNGDTEKYATVGSLASACFAYQDGALVITDLLRRERPEDVRGAQKLLKTMRRQRDLLVALTKRKRRAKK